MPKKKNKKSAMKKLQDITEKTNQLCLDDSDEDDDVINLRHNVNRFDAIGDSSKKWNVDTYMAGLGPSRNSGLKSGLSSRSDLGLPESSHGHSGLMMKRSKIRLPPPPGRETASPDLQFLNDDLSDEDVANLREVFSIFDTRACGTIAFKDLMRALRFLRLSVEEGEVRDVLKTLYCSGDAVGVELFMNCVVECEKRRVDWTEQIIRAMGRIDVDGKGSISVEDLKRFNSAMGLGLSDKDVVDMMLVADVGGDGVVDEREFVDVMLQTNLFSR